MSHPTSTAGALSAAGLATALVAGFATATRAAPDPSPASTAASGTAAPPTAAGAAATRPVEPANLAPRPPSLRASHRVDVIAPGERVQTVLDRMRAAPQPVPTPGGVRPGGDRLPVRGPDQGPPGGGPGQGPGHGGPEGPHGDGSHGPPPSGGPMTPPDRPHR